jgi:hypothetical protein
MNRAVPIVIGIVAIGILIGLVVRRQKGAHMVLAGQILNVRTFGTTPESSLAILDFRFTNPADYQFVVRDVRLFLVKKDRSEVEGIHVADPDMKRVFDFYPQLGQKYNESMIRRDKIVPKETLDRMVAARFDLPESELINRDAFVIRVEEIDGAVSELREERR